MNTRTLVVLSLSLLLHAASGATATRKDALHTGNTGSPDKISTTQGAETATTSPSAATSSKEARHSGTIDLSSGKKFVAKATFSNLAEIQLGRLALERAESPAVREFASNMVASHSKAQRELARIAVREGIAVPQELPKKDRGEAAKLARLNGTEFDKAYMKAMVRHHKLAIALHKQAASSSSTPSISAFAAQILPHLNHHLDAAKTLSGRM